MVLIRNKLNQRLIINLKKGSVILLAKGTAVIPDDDLSSPHLQTLLAKRDIVIQKEDKKKSKPEIKEVIEAEERPETEEKSEVEEIHESEEKSEADWRPETEEKSEVEEIHEMEESKRKTIHGKKKR